LKNKTLYIKSEKSEDDKIEHNKDSPTQKKKSTKTTVLSRKHVSRQ